MIPELPFDIWNIIFAYIDWRAIIALRDVSDEFLELCSKDWHNRILASGHSVEVIRGTLALTERIDIDNIKIFGIEYIEFRFTIQANYIKLYSIRIEPREDTFIVRRNDKLIGGYFTLRNAILALDIKNACLTDAFHDLINKYMAVYDIDS